MKNKDVVVLEKIMDYCNQIDEACDMFGNDYDKFTKLLLLHLPLLYELSQQHMIKSRIVKNYIQYLSIMDFDF